MKYTISKNGYYYKNNNKGLKTRISKKAFLEKKENNIEMNSKQKNSKLEKDALDEAIKFYKDRDNFTKVFVYKKGSKTYKLIPTRHENHENEFILITSNNKWKYIRKQEILDEGDYKVTIHNIGHLNLNKVKNQHKTNNQIDIFLTDNNKFSNDNFVIIDINKKNPLNLLEEIIEISKKYKKKKNFKEININVHYGGGGVLASLAIDVLKLNIQNHTNWKIE